ncbi:MAG: type II secretion system minor pseudopilin GspK [Sphingomonadaceae bacterium]|nr:type II secretion system minor pseudopilin GspK [Sphingomonadaceae bacterium]
MRVNASEQGAALLAVLLLVAVMSVLAATSLERLQLATRLAGNIASLDQARAYATGAEALAITRIEELAARDMVRTTLEGGWVGAESTLPLPDGGLAVARAWDGGNCFNLNSVVEGGEGRILVANPVGILQFAALMRVVGIRESEANRIAVALADWIDSDELPARGGAEDAVYSETAIPYRAANTMVVEPSELRAVYGVTPEHYARLRPWLCALPDPALSPINVNTLFPEQGPLLAMLLPDRLSAREAARIIAARPDSGWTNISEFWRQPALAALDPPSEVIAQPQIRTRWYRLDLEIRLGDIALEQSALIDSALSPARVVSRRWGADE